MKKFIPCDIFHTKNMRYRISHTENHPGGEMKNHDNCCLIMRAVKVGRTMRFVMVL